MERTARERFVAFGNRIVVPLVKRGLPIGSRKAPMALLTVRGRKSGQLRTAPVALAPTVDGWILVSVYGVSDWSRNLEAAGRATITMRGRTRPVDAVRLTPEEAAPILRDAVFDAPRFVRRMTSNYFDAGAGSSIEDWEKEALNHPVFRLIETAEDPFAAA